MTNENHAVWEIYDLLRTAVLTTKYYSKEITKLSNINLSMEILILITAPGSAVAGLWFWDTCIGAYIWRIFISVAAITSIIKVPLNFPGKIKKKEEELSSWRVLESDLRELSISIKHDKNYDEDKKNKFKVYLSRFSEIYKKEGAITVNRNLLHECEDEVKREYPLEWFYTPHD